MRDRSCESFARQVCTIWSEVKSEHVAHPKFLCIQLRVLFLDDFVSNHKCMMMLSTDIITRLSSDDTGCIYNICIYIAAVFFF